MTVIWEWCKKQWGVCLGFIAGILSVIFLLRRNNDMHEILQEKTDAEKKVIKAEREAQKKREESLQKNLDNFFEKNKEIDLNFKRKLKEVDDKKKEEINSILESDNPNETIARKLKEFLDN